MKGLITRIWVGCLCLGLTLTVPMFGISQISSRWFSKKRINSTDSSTISEFLRNFANNRLLLNQTVVPLRIKETVSVIKRSVKRGEVNYFENFTNKSIRGNSHKKAFKNSNTQQNSNGSVKNSYEYTRKDPVSVRNWGMIKITTSQTPASKTLTKHAVTYKIIVVRIGKTNVVHLKNRIRKSNYFLAQTKSVNKKLYEGAFKMENWQNVNLKTYNMKHSMFNKSECTWKGMVRVKRKTRHKRMANDISEKVKDSKKEKKQQVQAEADHHRKESAARKKQAQDKTLERIKTKRLQLKNARNSSNRLHTGGRRSRLKKMTENREKVKDNIPKRPQSSHRNETEKGPFSGGLTTKTNKGSSHHAVINSKDKSRRTEKKGIFDKKNSEKSVVGKKRKCSVNKKEEKSVSKEKKKNRNNEEYEDSSNNLTEKNSSKKSAKSLVQEKALLKSPRLEHKHTGTSKIDDNRAEDRDKRKYSDKLDSTKRDTNKKEHKKGEPKKKGHKKKSSRGKEDHDIDKQTAHQKVEKLSKSQIKNSKKHIKVLSEDSEDKSYGGEVSSGEHRKQKGRKNSQERAKKKEKRKKNSSNNGNSVKSGSAKKKSAKMEKKSEVASRSEKSTAIMNKKPNPKREKNEKNKNVKNNKTHKSNSGSNTKDVSIPKSGNEKHINEIEYLGDLGHVLGFGLGSSNQDHSRLQVWPKSVHKRPMTGGYASSGRLTRARSNLYGASASASF